MIYRWIWDKTTECNILLLVVSTHRCFISFISFIPLSDVSISIGIVASVLSKWSAVSCCINSSDIKSRECVVSVISITSAFWILHSMMTHSNQDGRELTLSEKQAIWMLKEKRKSFRAMAKTKGMEKSRVWKPPATPATTCSAEKTTVVDDRQIIKAVKINPKRRVSKITNNFQKAGVMLWQSTVLRRLWHRITEASQQDADLWPAPQI